MSSLAVPALVSSLLGAAAAVSAADAAAPPPNYAAAFLGTTVAYRPPGGSFGGFQNDVTPLLGYGRYVSPTISFELDLGPTFVKGNYSNFTLVPGVVWSFSPRAYVAARFLVPVDPEANFALFPGVGVIHSFKNGISPLVELNLVSYVGKGDPDFGVALTAGVLFSF